MKCSRCGREISEDKSFSHQGRVLCEDCYIEVASHAGKCDPWATYIATHTRESLGMTGTEGLTELQKKVYEFIKRQGKATREEVKQNLSLSEAKMDAQLTPLMHFELVKERSEGGNIYLVLVSQ